MSLRRLEKVGIRGSRSVGAPLREMTGCYVIRKEFMSGSQSSHHAGQACPLTRLIIYNQDS